MVTTMETEGLYLYCIAEGLIDSATGMTGVDDNEVYTIQYDGFFLIVHKCRAVVYRSDEREKVEKWILGHQNVIESVCKHCSAILPLGFNTIIRSDEKRGLTAEENIREWLRKDYARLKEKLNIIRNRVEYGIQILWNTGMIVNEIMQTVPEIKMLTAELRSKPPGTAYMYEQKLKGLLKTGMERRADECFKEFYGKIRPKVDDIKVDKTKKIDEEMQMLMNLSCLVYKDRVKELGEVLGEIDKKEAFSVRFTGPWPCYSFV